MTFAEIVKNGCNEWNLPITDEAVTRMERFSDALIEKNRVMNLTAVTEPEEIARRHMLDCLFLLTVILLRGGKPDLFFEKTTKIIWIVEADFLRNFKNG